MSDALAIAKVTCVLRDLLTNALSEADAERAMSRQIDFSARPPSRVPIGAEERPQLNVFLYHLTPNPGWRNRDLPSRDQRGDRVASPPLALDLHYLLTAYAPNDLEAEILLGYGMQALHEAPVLTRERIRRAVTATNGDQKAVTALGLSDLAEQVEQIRITPQPISTEEMSKLWSAFQAQYRPSTGYLVSVVLIDRKEPTRATLPVLSIGPVVNNRERGPVAQPSLLPPFPTLMEAVAPRQHFAAHLGDEVRLRGHHLESDRSGETVTVRFQHTRLREFFHDLVPAPVSTASEIAVAIPQSPAAWPAGVYTATVHIGTAGQPPRQMSNDLPVAIAPTVQTADLSAVRVADQIRIEAKVSPALQQGQRVALTVAGVEIPGPVIPATSNVPLPTTTKVTFVCAAGDVTSGTQAVRVRVDGVDSVVIDRSGAVPVFEPLPTVSIPQ
jgi:hypothetical protein